MLFGGMTNVFIACPTIYCAANKDSLNIFFSENARDISGFPLRQGVS